MLGEKVKSTSSLRSANGNERSFRSVKKTMLSTMNSFRECCAETSPGHGLKIDFSKEGSSQKLTRSFNENGIHGILDAFDVDFIDNVRPFLRGTSR